MGKIRVKTLGDEELEQEQKEKAIRKSQGKREREGAKKVVKVPGMKGGEADLPAGRQVAAVGPSEEELEKLDSSDSTVVTSDVAVARKTSTTIKPKRSRSKKYKTVASLIDKTKIYSLSEALELLPKLKISSFDETVELHINTNEQGVSGTVNLPHGTGKKRKIAIADDSLIKDIEKGKITFDVLLATPDIMPKLAKVARILGPKGLMPNPKNGTITTSPDETMKKFEGGHMNFKTESKSPIIHLSVGKLSFGDKKLKENINTILSELPESKIKKITLKSTMSPGIKINFSTA